MSEFVSDQVFTALRFFITFVCIYVCLPVLSVGRDSVVCTATRYRLDGLGIESRLGQDFPHPPRPALGPTQPPTQWVPDNSRGLVVGALR
jgi:hypothetical protein